MRRRHCAYLSLVFLFVTTFWVVAQKENKRDAGPLKITLCQLKNDPPAYDHKEIEITGFVSHGFEDFTLFDPSCSSWPEVWLEYGGTSVSGTMYCCGVTPSRNRPNQLVIEGVPISLNEDERFREFDKLVQRRPDSIVHATISGRFFSGELTKAPQKNLFGGFGHMGCCSLLAIQQVLSVDPQNRDDLDYGATADQPESKEGCGYEIFGTRPHAELLKDQKSAESDRGWAFSDPERVASEGLVRELGPSKPSNIKMKQTRQTQGRFVYQWQQKGKEEIYMVVVSRPYWLSFYAHDPQRVAWIVVAAYRSSCNLG